MTFSSSKKGLKTLYAVIIAVIIIVAAVAIGLAYVYTRPSSSSGKITITFSYNQYFQDSFTPGIPTTWASLVNYVNQTFPNINLVFLEAPSILDTWHDLYVTYFNAGSSTPDILGIINYWIPEFVTNKWILPLSGYIQNSLNETIAQFENGWFPQVMAMASYPFTAGSELYGIPWWAGIGGLYYRSDLLNDCGLQPPQTYDQLVSDVQTIFANQTLMAANPGLVGYTWPGMQDQSLVNCWTAYFDGFGGQWYNTTTGACTVNDAGGIAALTYMRNLITQGISPPAVTTWKEEEAEVDFEQGKAIFELGRNDLFSTLSVPGNPVYNEWGFEPNPAESDGFHAGAFEGWSMAINAFSKHPQQAWDVLQVLSTYNMQKEILLSQGPLQGVEALFNDSEVLSYYPTLPALTSVMPTGQNSIVSISYTAVSDVLQQDLSAALTGIMSPTAALNDAATRIDAINAQTPT